MNYFRLIFIIFTLFAFSTKANDVQIIELHKNKSLDQLVLEKVNNENDEDNESKSINIENDINITEDSNIIEDNSNSDNIDNQNVRVFVDKEYQNVKPSVVKTDDKEKYWSLLTAVYPTFNLYRSKTDRDIPLVKLITEQV